MTGIIEFLEARIAEDERRFDLPDFIEENSARGPGWGNRGPCPICGAYMFSGYESVTEDGWWDHAEYAHWRTRWLAECAAKRSIIEQVSDVAWGGYAVRDVILGHLAAIYKGHPGFDKDWLTP